MNTDTELLRKLVELARNGGPWKCGEPLLVHDVNILQDLQACLPALSRLLEAGVPEGQAGNEPDRDLWMRVAFYAIKAAEKQNGVRLIPMGDEDAEAFMDSIAVALEESLEEIMTGYLDEPHPPSEGEQT